MLKTRITEQYGLKVPFINAGMAFIAPAPLVRAVCKAGGVGNVGRTGNAPRGAASGAPRSEAERLW
jgi:NAD(P)H-dependent flavin oxidoreductase YrpB (nitropropane dioxygenase family)